MWGQTSAPRFRGAHNSMQHADRSYAGTCTLPQWWPLRAPRSCRRPDHTRVPHIVILMCAVPHTRPCSEMCPPHVCRPHVPQSASELWCPRLRPCASMALTEVKRRPHPAAWHLRHAAGCRRDAPLHLSLAHPDGTILVTSQAVHLSSRQGALL